ncbi:hypothetical protein ACWGI0_14275 [Streptomyces sp. NPDC054802]
MHPEEALLETRALRAALSHRTDALDGAKPLVLLPDGVHATAAMLADHFEVDAVALRRTVRRHAGELTALGHRRLQGEELRRFVAANMPGSRAGRGQLGVFTRQTVLGLAMLLRGSQVARRVRQRLLTTPVETGGAPTGARGGAPRGAAPPDAMFLAIGTPEQIAEVLRRGL